VSDIEHSVHFRISISYFRKFIPHHSQ